MKLFKIRILERTSLVSQGHDNIRHPIRDQALLAETRAVKTMVDDCDC